MLLHSTLNLDDLLLCMCLCMNFSLDHVMSCDLCDVLSISCRKEYPGDKN